MAAVVKSNDKFFGRVWVIFTGMRPLSFSCGVFLLFFALAAHAATTDDMQIYSGRFDNGWGDNWSWMPRYGTNSPVYTNYPVYVSSNSMALVPSGTYQGWWLKAGIIIDSTCYPQVWLANSGDVFAHNIIWRDYGPARMYPPPWGKGMDCNLVQKAGARPSPATGLQNQSGRDAHSIVADADFVDPAKGDYRVKAGSPALALDFVNFPMDQFGLQKPELKAIARVPELPQPGIAAPASAARAAAPVTWFGASVRNIAGEGGMSAFGLPGVTGVLVLGVPAESAPAKAGLRKNDVILSENGEKTADTAALLRQAPASSTGSALKIGISRSQKEIVVQLVP